jgi:hypothetical protein
LSACRLLSVKRAGHFCPARCERPFFLSACSSAVIMDIKRNSKTRLVNTKRGRFDEKKEKKKNLTKQKQTNMSIFSSFCTLKHRKSGSPRRSRAWSPRILNRRQHRDTVITLSHCCSDVQRICEICNKTITSKTPKGLSNNFNEHLRTHG